MVLSRWKVTADFDLASDKTSTSGLKPVTIYISDNFIGNVMRVVSGIDFTGDMRQPKRLTIELVVAPPANTSVTTSLGGVTPAGTGPL